MKIRYIEAVLESKRYHQEVDCIQLGNLYVCADKTNRQGHLVYDYAGWLDELRHNGFAIKESEMTIKVKQSTFNELDIKHFELKDSEIYLFADLAVKVDDTLKVFSKKDITIQDAVQKWKLEDEPENLTPDMEITIPLNAHGGLAIKIEKLHYDVWDSFFRCPGEATENEERLASIAGFYQDLSDGKSVSEMLQDTLSDLRYIIEEYNTYLHSPTKVDNQEFYIGKLEECERVVNMAKSLLGTDSEVEEFAKLLPSISLSQCVDEEMEER